MALLEIIGQLLILVIMAVTVGRTSVVIFKTPNQIMKEYKNLQRLVDLATPVQRQRFQDMAYNFPIQLFIEQIMFLVGLFYYQMFLACAIAYATVIFYYLKGGWQYDRLAMDIMVGKVRLL